MHWFIDLFQNPFLMVALSSWFIAQVIKTILFAVLNKELNWERLFGDGGMPSGHSATVSSLATMSALVYGTGSFQFAVTAVLAIIVCHDATGVRLETGKQAALINEMLRSIDIWTSKELTEVKLKEFVGHTPSQVAVGIFIGVVNAIVMYNLFY